MVKAITGKIDFIESLRGKDAAFLLCMSNTKTADIEGITQAGIPGSIYLTPTLDGEFISTGEVRSLENIAETPKGVPTPALLTRAVQTLTPFKSMELLDLGLKIKPKLDYFKVHDLKLNPSRSISDGADIDAFDLFQIGVNFAMEYEPKGEYVIIGESVPSGTTTALATALALGYDVKDKFSSSFKNSPKTIKDKTVQEALNNIDPNMDLFEKLGFVSDNMLIFCAGFIFGANAKDYRVILAGGTQMACVLLIVNSILKKMEGVIDSSKFALVTTKWVAHDENSDIEALLNMVDFKVNGYYSDFDFSLTKHPALKLYDEGEAKEGVGAGGALMYGILNGLTQEDITKRVESFLS